MTEEITTLSMFIAHMDEFRASLEERYGQRILRLEDRNAELVIFVQWGWALAKECKYHHSRQSCGITGGACRPLMCPLIGNSAPDGAKGEPCVNSKTYSG